MAKKIRAGLLNSRDEALLEFVEAIEATGGVTRDDSGLYAPVADQEWVDLGEAYINACAALGVKPVIAEAEDALRFFKSKEEKT
jgi:hypothetical protein